MRANGLGVAALARRSVATAGPSRAWQARWKPPTPLTATIAPRAQRRAQRRVPGLALPAHSELRPAGGAGVGLRVEAAVSGSAYSAGRRRTS